MTRKKNNELGQGKKKEKKKGRKRERFFSPLTHKLHQFTLRIRLYLKKGEGGRLELDGAIQIKMGERGS